MRRGALVLCGGGSTRMGRDKASLPFGGETLLQRVVGTVSAVVDEVIVIARPGQDLPPVPAGVRVVHDEIPDLGPLGGLVPGLRASTSDALYATACDVPFLQPALVTHLFESLGEHDVAVAEAQGYTHPLCGVYRRSVLGALQRLLDARRLRPVFLYEEVPTLRVSEEELRQWDPELLTLRNLNNPAEYEAALADRDRLSRPVVLIELYDLARLRCGAAQVRAHATTLGEALEELARLHPALVPEVITNGRLARHWRISRAGSEFVDDPATPLRNGETLLLLSALAGG